MREIRGHRIDKVAVVDDSIDGRATMRDEVSDGQFTPVPLEGPFKDCAALVGTLSRSAEAAVLDHHLNTRNFAGCTGAEAAEHLYHSKMPAVLVTSWSDVEIVTIRRYLRWMPLMLPRQKADIDAIVRGFELCVAEFNDEYIPVRKPWRTVVRVEEVRETDNTVCCVVPAWNVDQVVQFPLDQMPSSIRPKVKEGFRCFARVNVGAEESSQLYLCDFEG